MSLCPPCCPSDPVPVPLNPIPVSLLPPIDVPAPPRFSMRVNTTDLFHVDLRHWTTLRSRDGARGPRERAFHSATVIGDYMVVYGERRPPRAPRSPSGAAGSPRAPPAHRPGGGR